MELNFLSRSLFLFLVLSNLSSLSSSSFISDGAFEAQSSSTGRNLLQTKKPCRVNFEFMNYKIITDKCKGPKFPAKECCAAFKEFSCPYVDEINDLSTDCATTMFSYINLYGKYPPGLFANLCKEGKEGLECPATSPSSAADVNAAVRASSSSSKSLLLTVSAALLVFIKLF